MRVLVGHLEERKETVSFSTELTSDEKNERDDEMEAEQLLVLPLLALSARTALEHLQKLHSSHRKLLNRPPAFPTSFYTFPPSVHHKSSALPMTAASPSEAEELR